MKSLKITIAALTITLLSNVSMAQEKTAESRAKRETEAISEKLALSSEQEAKVYQINLATDTQNETVKNDEMLTDNEKRAAFEINNKARMEEIKAVLNPDQVKQFEEADAKRKEKLESRKNSQPRVASPMQIPQLQEGTPQK